MTLHDLIADKLERADPETRQALLRIPLENIDRWIANGHTAPQRLEQWRQIILRAQGTPDGFQELLRLFRDRSEATERLRDFAPFAGVLTAAERAVIIRQCAYSH
ncbi:MAG: hypothetical protein HY735_03695 [Verrucomicrobia bacterium]|nr:hypothetical protein [Verrucomicrobiota bacterium]